MKLIQKYNTPFLFLDKKNKIKSKPKNHRYLHKLSFQPPSSSMPTTFIQRGREVTSSATLVCLRKFSVSATPVSVYSNIDLRSALEVNRIQHRAALHRHDPWPNKTYLQEIYIYIRRLLCAYLYRSRNDTYIYSSLRNSKPPLSIPVPSRSRNVHRTI